MHISHLSILSCVLALTLASARPEIDARKCADKCYKQVLANKKAPGGKSKPGCNELFLTTVIPCPATSTKTVKNTVSHVDTTTITSTVTDKDVKTITDTSTSTTEVTSYSTTVTSITYASRAHAAATHKRGLDDSEHLRCTRKTKSATAVPTYFAACPNIAAYSSACSCLKAPHKTVTRTLKPVTTTVTRTSTFSSVKTVVTTVTKQQPNAVTVTTTAVQTVTATGATATAYCTAPADLANVSTADSSIVVNPGQVEYRWQAQRQGYVLNPNNPGVDPPYDVESSYFDASLALNDAASLCASAAHAITSNPNTPGSLGYGSFDVHFLCLESQWECKQYPKLNTDASTYDEPNEDAVVGVLYSFNH